MAEAFIFFLGAFSSAISGPPLPHQTKLHPLLPCNMDNQELQQSDAVASALQSFFSYVAQLVIYGASTTATIIPLPNTQQEVSLKLSNTNFLY